MGALKQFLLHPIIELMHVVTRITTSVCLLLLMLQDGTCVTAAVGNHVSNQGCLGKGGCMRCVAQASTVDVISILQAWVHHGDNSGKRDIILGVIEESVAGHIGLRTE